jgi:hypothetical protein
VRGNELDAVKHKVGSLSLLELEVVPSDTGLLLLCLLNHFANLYANVIDSLLFRVDQAHLVQRNVVALHEHFVLFIERVSHRVVESAE